MSIFPVIIDSRPEYLRGTLSLSQLPLGDASVLTYFGSRLASTTGRAPIVVRAFETDVDPYDQVLLASRVIREASIPADQFYTRLGSYEPSDWILFVDVSCLPADGFDPSPLLGGLDETPRLARHLITLATSPAGTQERVEFGPDQRVRRVQRYYDAVTWTVVGGVSASMIPVAALLTARSLPCHSLVDMRRALAAACLPFRDVTVPRAVIDLSTERAYLAFNEGYMAAAINGQQRAPGQTQAGSSRIVGHVIMHPDCAIDDGVTIIGPTVVGAGARVQRGAVVAQCVIAPGVQVPAASVHRQRILAGDLHERPAVEPESTSLDDPLVSLRNEQEQSRVYPSVKLVAEATIAVLALITVSPLLLLVGLLVKLTSRGPVFYGDLREAMGGRVFRCYKFRTMRVGADLAQRELASANQMDGPQFKLDHDPRVTSIGRWLRLTSLDELPQLFNVAMGQMSLVGPRPSPFRENQTCVPWREARLSVRPGITGLWQVCRHNREAGDFHQWIYYDIKYIRHMSLFVDLKIILATFWTVFGKGSVPMAWIIPSVEESV